ncbi:MAG: single-stranded DNA-binding protein [Clostridia bacterium]|nr:single-stranded DNA-binding protein [Clostridia bacterium]
MTNENAFFENNIVYIAGEVSREPVYSHEIYGEKFYIFSMDVERLSNSHDTIPVLVSERLVSIENLKKGVFLEVDGQFRSYNNTINGHSKLILNVFARDARIVDSLENIHNRNAVFFDGYICKEPNYRTTPFGREITDMLIAVNRAYNKSDYIPCICWGRNARYCEKLQIGANLKIWGRIQSRYYEKKFDSDNIVKKVAYEVSVTKLEAVVPEEVSKAQTE